MHSVITPFIIILTYIYHVNYSLCGWQGFYDSWSSFHFSLWVGNIFSSCGLILLVVFSINYWKRMLQNPQFKLLRLLGSWLQFHGCPFPVEVNPEFYSMCHLLPNTSFEKEPSKSQLLWSLRTLKQFARDVEQFASSLFATESCEPWHSLGVQGVQREYNLFRRCWDCQKNPKCSKFIAIFLYRRRTVG